METGDIIRVILWPGMLYLIIRMGWRAYHYHTCCPDLMIARAAISVLFISRSLTMAENWHQPLLLVSWPFTVLAIFLVWRSKEL
jgi:hypothetical protein